MEIIVDVRSPLVEPQYSPPKKVQEMVLEDIELMIKYGILEESRGSYQSPLIAKLKGDGKIRLVNNYKTINRRIKDVQFPIPRTKEVLEEIQGKKYISTVDFYKGFYHIPLKKECREFTGFSIKGMHLQYTWFPQGIKTGPAYLSMAVAKAQRPCHGFCTSYFDDVMVYSATVELIFLDDL